MKKWQVGWGPVVSCNLACEFCYSKTARQSQQKLTYNDWINFIDNNHQSIATINYGTGENTISPDWFRLINHIRTNYPEIKQALTTNGYLSHQLKQSPELHSIVTNSIDEIDISLDFADKTQYCKFRGNDNVYTWAIDTLKFCQKNNIQSTIVFIGGKPILSLENISGLFAIAKEHSALIRMNIYRPTNPSKEINEKFIAPFEQLIDTIYYIDKNHKILSISDPLFSSILTDGFAEADPSGHNSVRILHNGHITPSTYLISNNFQLYDIGEPDVFTKIATEGKFNTIFKIPDKCQSCQFCETCKGGVYDRRYLWYQDFTKRDPYCPYRDENFIPERKVSICEDNDFESVHHGYLPTLFFSY